MATADACYETSNTAAIGRSGREGNFYTSHIPTIGPAAGGYHVCKHR